jgi:peptidoglycan endopeptidase LytF
MTNHDQHTDEGGVRERLGDVMHAVQEAVADRVAPVAERVAPVAERVAPAVDAVTSALHEAGHVAQSASPLGKRQAGATHEAEPAAPERELVPSGTQIVRPHKGSSTFVAWRDGRWAPVYREHGSGWFWGA